MRNAFWNVIGAGFVEAQKEAKKHRLRLVVGDRVLFRDPGAVHRQPFVITAMTARRVTIRGIRNGTNRPAVFLVRRAMVVRALDAFVHANTIAHDGGHCVCTEYNRVAARLVR